MEVSTFYRAQFQVIILKGVLGKAKLELVGILSSGRLLFKCPDSRWEQGYHTVKFLGRNMKWLFSHHCCDFYCSPLFSFTCILSIFILCLNCLFTQKRLKNHKRKSSKVEALQLQQLKVLNLNYLGFPL